MNGENGGLNIDERIILTSELEELRNTVESDDRGNERDFAYDYIKGLNNNESAQQFKKRAQTQMREILAKKMKISQTNASTSNILTHHSQQLLD